MLESIVGDSGGADLLSPICRRHPWPLWMTNQHLWMETASRLLDTFADLLTQLSSATTGSNSKDITATLTNSRINASVGSILDDVRQLRQNLMPHLLEAIPRGIGSVLESVGTDEEDGDKSADFETLKATVAAFEFDWLKVPTESPVEVIIRTTSTYSDISSNGFTIDV